MRMYFDLLDSFTLSKLVKRSRDYDLGIALYNRLKDEELKREIRSIDYMSKTCLADALRLAAKYGFTDLVLSRYKDAFTDEVKRLSRTVSIGSNAFKRLSSLQFSYTLGEYDCDYHREVDRLCKFYRLEFYKFDLIINDLARYGRISALKSLNKDRVRFPHDILNDAIEGERLETVKELLSMGFELTGRYANNAAESSFEVLEYVLSKGDNMYRSIVFNAIAAKKYDNAIYLYELYVDRYSLSDLRTILRECIYANALKLFLFFIGRFLDQLGGKLPDIIIECCLRMDRDEILREILDRLENIPESYKNIFKDVSNYENSPKSLRMLMRRFPSSLRNLCKIAESATKMDNVSIIRVIFEENPLFKESIMYWQKNAIRQNSLKILDYLLDKGGYLISLASFAARLKRLDVVKCIMKRMNREELIITVEFTRSNSKRVRKYFDSIRDEL